MALKPLSIGEIVDRSTSFWRSHWKPMFQLFLGFQLTQFVLLKGLELVIDRVFPAARSLTRFFELLKADPSTWAPGLGPLTIGAIAVVLLNLLVSQVGGVALTTFVYPRLTDVAGPSIGESLKVAFSRFGTTVGMFLLSLVWTVVVGLLFLLPAVFTFGAAIALTSRGQDGGGVIVILGSLLLLGGMVSLAVWFLIRFVLASQVVAVERIGAFQCFKRTNALSSGRIGEGMLGLVKGRLTILITIIAFILTVVGVATSVPELIVRTVYGGFSLNAEAAAPPQVLLVPAQLLQVVLGAAVAPLYVVFQVVFYVDMRVRREGLDLELATKAAP